jgi:hypothetical protein
MLSLISTNPVQRAARALLFPFAVERGRDRFRIRIDFDHRVDPRPRLVDRLDPRAVGAHEPLRRRGAILHRALQIGHARLDDIESRAPAPCAGFRVA